MTTERLKRVLNNRVDEGKHRVFIQPARKKGKLLVLESAKDCYFDEDGDLIIEVE